MDQNERRIIDDLFAKLRRVDDQAPPRDTEAEGLIQQHLARLPGAAYYMAQAIVVQERALEAAQARVRELEQTLTQRPAGGFLSGLFGGGEETADPRDVGGERQGRRPGPYQPAPGGFLGGAVQTALGVAGGVLIADAITSAFATDPAAAAEPLPQDHAPAQDDLPEVEDTGDNGDFGFDEF